MKMNMEKGRLTIELPAESVELLVNGSKQAEYVLGIPEGPEDFTERLQKANAASAACSMMRAILGRLEKPKNSGTGKGERERRASFADGLAAGLRGEFRRLYAKGSGVGNAVQAPEPPKGADYSAFVDGWQIGQGIFGAVGIADTGQDPRANW